MSSLLEQDDVKILLVQDDYAIPQAPKISQIVIGSASIIDGTFDFSAILKSIYQDDSGNLIDLADQSPAKQRSLWVQGHDAKGGVVAVIATNL